MPIAPARSATEQLCGTAHTTGIYEQAEEVSINPKAADLSRVRLWVWDRGYARSWIWTSENSSSSHFGEYEKYAGGRGLVDSRR